MTLESPVPDLVISAATMEDFDEMVAAHGVVFAGTTGVALGMRYRRAFIERFIREPDQIALVARRGETLVGYVLGRSVDAPPDNQATKLGAAIGIALHPWLIFRANVRRLIGMKLRPVPKDDANVDPILATAEGDLVGIGCLPSERGKGTAKALVTAFVAACAEMGWQNVILSVYRNNESARGLYRSMGFVEVDHPAHAELIYEVLTT